jgi:hypothetical protein
MCAVSHEGKQSGVHGLPFLLELQALILPHNDRLRHFYRTDENIRPGQGQTERYKIERKYGEAKEYHGLRRCRYLSWIRYAIQAYLTAIALNLKRIVKALTGVSFKGDVMAMV